MSLYFDGFFACDLKLDVSQQVIDTLNYMTRDDEYEFTNIPQHDFFKTEGWDNFLRPEKLAVGEVWTCAPGLIAREFKRKTRPGPYNSRVEYYTLSFRRTMHDDMEFYIQWWQFLFWIASYSDTTGFVGYYRESADLHPDLIYFKDGAVFLSRVKSVPEGMRGESWNEPHK